MSLHQGLRRKIWVVFVLQIAAISFATVVGVYGAAAILKDVLIKEALKDEAGHYFQRLAADPAAELPDTYNMRGYLVRQEGDRAALPVRELMSANLLVRGVLLYSMPHTALRSAVIDVMRAVSAGALTPLPVHRFPLERTADAHDAVEGGAVGKVVIDIPA